MTINISGILKTPSGAVLQNAEILFEQTRTSLEVLAGTDYSLITTSAGAYQTAIGIGTYTLKVRFQEDIQYRQIASNVIVIPSMQNYTINQIIAEQTGLENVDYDVLEEVLQARDAAQASQQQALVSKNAAQGSATQAQSSQSQANTSKNAAQVSQTQAQSSQTAAQGSAATASTKASEASISQINAAASEAQALASNNAQKTSETNSQVSAASALASKNAAQTSANTANTKANEASASQTAAQQSQQDALVSKNQAQTSQSNASTSEFNAAASEAQALASKNATQTSATSAQSSQTQANTSKNAAQASATSAQGSATTATNKAAEASASAAAASDSQSTATTKATEADSSASSALASKNAAQASATQAQASATTATTATTKATEAAASATSAQSSASTATTKAQEATTRATAAQTSATLAQKWAANPEDSTVSGGLFSALHYAAKASQAAQTAVGQLIWRGGWSAQAGTPPPTPAGTTVDFYRITAAGTILSVSYSVGDYIHWDNINSIWFKMDGTDSVISVNGKAGDVTLNAADVGAVSKTGDTMTGNLVVDAGTTAEPQVGVRRSGRRLYMADNGVTVGLYNIIGGSFSNMFMISRNINDGNLIVGIDGNNTVIRGAGNLKHGTADIYTTDNRPSPADIGTMTTAQINTELAKQVSKTGDTMTGDLTAPAVLVSSAQNTSVNALTRKDYVDSANLLKLDKAGGTVSGNLTVSGILAATLTGNASTATKLATTRAIALSSDVTGTANFDGSAAISIQATLANSGVTAGTYTKVTVDSKGRTTAGQALVVADIPSLSWSKITTGKPTTLQGYGITDAAPSSHVGETGTAHGEATTSVSGFISAQDKTKLNGIDTSANNYVHPTSDGSKHVPATGTTSNGKVLKAGATAGVFSWGTLTASDVGALPITGGTLTGQLVIDVGGIAHRMTNSSKVQYYQGGSNTDDQLQNLAFSGYNEKALTLARFVMQDTVSPVVRWGNTDYKIFHAGNVPSAALVGTYTTAQIDTSLATKYDKSGGVLSGQVTVANMKSAIKVDSQKSISYQDGGGAMFHHLAVGSVFQLATGLLGTSPLWAINQNGLTSQSGPAYAKTGVVVQSVDLTKYLAMECSDGSDPCIASRGVGEGQTSVAMRFGSTIVVEKPTTYNSLLIAGYTNNRSWNSYGVGSVVARELIGTAGMLRAAITYPFRISGVYALDAYLGTYAKGPSPGNLQHVLGFTDGGSYAPAWMFSANGYISYSSAPGVGGTIASESPMTAPSFTPTSDGRLKPVELRQAIVDATSLLRKLNPQYYFKKYGIEVEKGFYEFGFIADEVEEHEPRLVFETNDAHKLKHLAVNGIVAHLSQGFKELDDRIAKLEQLINKII